MKHTLFSDGCGNLFLAVYNEDGDCVWLAPHIYPSAAGYYLRCMKDGSYEDLTADNEGSFMYDVSADEEDDRTQEEIRASWHEQIKGDPAFYCPVYTQDGPVCGEDGEPLVETDDTAREALEAGCLYGKEAV